MEPNEKVGLDSIIHYINETLEMLQKNNEEYKRSLKLSEEQQDDWNIGNIQGRLSATGSEIHKLKFIKSELSSISNSSRDSYGFRDGFPSPEQIKVHHDLTLGGLWILIYEIDSMPGQMAISSVLNIEEETGKVIVLKDGEVWNIGHTEKVLRSMPIEFVSGIPSNWDIIDREVEKGV